MNIAGRRFLGLDGGGSSLRWVVVDVEKQVVARDESRAIQAATMDAEEVTRALGQTLAKCCGRHRPEAVVLGLAGAGSTRVRDYLRHSLGALVRGGDFALCGDIELAAAATHGSGMRAAAWAGTGSFAIAFDAQDVLHRVGGRGHRIGDDGSGYAIGRGGARAVVRAMDGLAPEPGFTAALLDAFEARDVLELSRRVSRATPREVSAIAPVVIESARSGDEVAQRVVDDEIHELVRQVRTVARRADATLDVCGVGGGVMRGSAWLRSRFEVRLGVPVRLVETEEAVAAALLARAIRLEKDGPHTGWLA